MVSMSTAVVAQKHEESTIYPVVSADRLLSQAGHQQLLSNIEKQLAQDAFRYEYLYAPLIAAFAEYVQVLPDVTNKQQALLLNLGLERAWYMSRDYVKDMGDAADYVRVFALFSAALLLDIGQVDLHKKIDICTKKGVFLKEWSPILGVSLINDGDYYKLRESFSNTVKLSHIVTPILATPLMPEIGALCLREQPELFAAWIAILARDDSVEDPFAADFKAYNSKYLNGKYVRCLDDIELESFLDMELEAGEAFWKWMKEGIQSGKIAINKEKGFVHKVGDGLFIDYKELAKKFSSIYSDKFPNWTVVVQQFNSMGIAKLSGGDYKYEQFFGDKGKMRVSTLFGGMNKMANKVQLPAGVVIEDVRGLLNTNSARSQYVSGSIASTDKSLGDRANRLYGVAVGDKPKPDPNQ